MNRSTVATALFLAAVTVGHAALRADPQIMSVAISPEVPDCIFMQIAHAPCKAAISTNGGESFVVSTETNIPAGWSTNLTAGTRRYSLTGYQVVPEEDYLWMNRLFRSDDSGATWVHTAATEFLMAQMKIEIDHDKVMYLQWYGSRLPARSVLWHPLFGVFSCAYFLIVYFRLRRTGRLSALLTGLRGLALLIGVWCFLSLFHAVMIAQLHYELRLFDYWHAWRPSTKLGLAMSIAARPLPLLAYLLMLWSLLPGSREVLIRLLPPDRKKTASGICIAAGMVFVVFHLILMFVGSFQE